MSDSNTFTGQGRRRFCMTVGAAVGVASFAHALSDRAAAADLPRLQESEALATSMGYKEDAKKVDTKKHANYKPDQTCVNCQFYQGAKDAAAGPCQIFAGKSVTAKGWCQVWAKKA